MSTESKANGQSDEQTNGELNNQESTTDAVKNPDAVLKKNRELLAKLKEKSEAEQKLKEQLEQIEQDKLAQSGKKDELIDSLRKQIRERDEKLKTVTQTFAFKTVDQQVVDAARDMGCTKPEMIKKLADLSGVTVSDDFSVDRDALKLALEKVKEDLPELFKKTPSAPRDGTPAAIMQTNEVGKMSIKELQDAYRKSVLGS